jgi:hypothetical protein
LPVFGAIFRGLAVLASLLRSKAQLPPLFLLPTTCSAHLSSFGLVVE